MDVDPQKAWATRVRRARREAARLAERAARGRKLAEELADACAEAGAERVVLFGSLATGRYGRVDIDLAVTGLPRDRYFDLLGELLWDAAPDFTVDLVRTEDAPPLLHERITEEGEVLREQA